jgi:hypothetical protein
MSEELVLVTGGSGFRDRREPGAARVAEESIAAHLPDPVPTTAVCPLWRTPGGAMSLSFLRLSAREAGGATPN